MRQDLDESREHIEFVETELQTTKQELKLSRQEVELLKLGSEGVKGMELLWSIRIKSKSI